MRTAKLSSDGQITLPVDMLRAIGADEGTEFVVIQEGEQVLLIPANRAGRLRLDELPDWEALAEPAFEDLWGNEADEVSDPA